MRVELTRMACPEPSALQEFIEGTLPSPHQDGLKEHFAHCDECRELVLALSSSDAAPRAREWMLGRYEVLHRLGEGGMGVVYAARDPDLGRRVALKLLRRAASADRVAKEGEARLLREAQAMARLNHPNVIIVHDVGTYDDGVFIAMELVEGETLGQWMSRERPWHEVVDMLLRAGRGLEAAHAAGLVHRDFKPENVLVGRDGRVRVTDFGLARMVTARKDEASQVRERALDRTVELTLTDTGALVGTPAYMAPEQLGGAASDVRTDVFSFCVVMFEALFRRRPFAGTSLHELRDAIARNEVAVVADRHVPRRLRAVLQRGLRATPGERHPTMTALLAAIEAARRDRRPRAALAGALLLALAGAIVWRVDRAQAPTATAPLPPVATAAAPSRVMPAPAAPSPSGRLVVRVVGHVADVALDGALVATSTARAELDLKADRDYALTVSAPGFREYHATVRVAAGAAVDKEVVLERAVKRRPARGGSPTGPAVAAPAPIDDPNAAIDPYAP
ncbi:MAG TPA: serine/threonine-protein kinase [Polyangia bacterium]